MSDRYQDQNWIVKIWRRRWYLLIPFDVLLMWARYRLKHRRERPGDDELPMSFSNFWSLAIGIAQCKMMWVYEWEDVKARLKGLNLETDEFEQEEDQ